MTTVAAYVQDGKVYMAADSQSTDDNYVADYTTNKIHRRGKLLFAGAGDMRPLSVLAHTIPNPSATITDKYMALTFPATVRELLEAQSCDVEGTLQLIIAAAGKIYSYSSADELCAPVGEYFAIGSGAHFALGALHSLQTVDIEPKPRLHRAIGAAICFDTNTGGYIQIDTLD
jgi:ATP-dependent protease HslVU (ClpYQ) peptidase subunit